MQPINRESERVRERERERWVNTPVCAPSSHTVQVTKVVCPASLSPSLCLWYSSAAVVPQLIFLCGPDVN